MFVTTAPEVAVFSAFTDSLTFSIAAATPRANEKEFGGTTQRIRGKTSPV